MYSVAPETSSNKSKPQRKSSRLDTRQRNGGMDGEGHGESDGWTAGDAAADGAAEEFETKLSVRDLFCQLSVGLFLILGRLRTTFWQPRATSADSRYRRGTPLTVRRTAPPGSMDRRIARKCSSRPASSSRVGSLLLWAYAGSASRAHTTPCVTPGRVSGSITSATKSRRGGGSYWMSIGSPPPSKQLRAGSGGKISFWSISMGHPGFRGSSEPGRAVSSVMGVTVGCSG